MLNESPQIDPIATTILLALLIVWAIGYGIWRIVKWLRK